MSRKTKTKTMKNLSKQFLLLFLAGVLFISCNNGSNAKTESNNDTSNAAATATTQKMDYPYTIDRPDNWDMGSQQNTYNALSALKAWENRNMDECMKYFADTVRVRFDGLDRKVSNDSLRSIISPDKMTKGVVIKMEDWESVISKDKKDEYVTIWYTQYSEKMNGTKDSIDVINDIKMKDGKIIGLEEYTRKLH